ncbi:ACT domain-containing protein [Flavobacterium hungaricum]|uniref:ACT domain-containing protein n=1 Tax=Flavobacterium hungaricum TaxID=2082725 RepID=A0ABR9TRC9_9FLAO|nr:ACT domain-containing protein [Flavobacterium hungaricum]MBE8727937.1 ACT domain-containing protein [Flavobacterium hungaricum]
MSGEKNLEKILKNLNPVLNDGRYVYCCVKSTENIPFAAILFLFKETEGITVILKKEDADQLNLEYSYIAAWITFNVHSSLEAVGMTAAFSAILGQENISCNVVAGYYHDHIFIDQKDAQKAMKALSHFQSN